MDRLQVDATLDGVDDALKLRSYHTLDPTQMVDDVLTVGSEAQNLADALVHIRIGMISVHGIPRNEHRHRWGDYSRHRPDRVPVVAGDKFDATIGKYVARRFRRCRPPFVNCSANHGTLHWTAHLLPRNRRAGMKQCTSHLRPHVLCMQSDVNQHRACIYHPLYGF